MEIEDNDNVTQELDQRSSQNMKTENEQNLIYSVTYASEDNVFYLEDIECIRGK